VAVLDTGTNQVVSTIPVPAGPHGIVITPDGRWVYVSSDGASTVSVIDTTTDSISQSLEVGSMPQGLAITPDASMVLVAGFGTNQVSAIDTATNKILWKVGVMQPHNFAITQDGKTAYVASQDPNAPALATIDLANGTRVGTVALDSTPRALNVSPDGQEVFFTEAGVDTVQVLDIATNTIVDQIPVGASPHLPSFTPDGNLGLIVAQGPGELDLVDPDAYTNLGAVKVGTMPHWTATSGDSSTAYVTNELSNDLSVVDLTNQTVTDTIPVATRRARLPSSRPCRRLPQQSSSSQTTHGVHETGLLPAGWASRFVVGTREARVNHSRSSCSRCHSGASELCTTAGGVLDAAEHVCQKEWFRIGPASVAARGVPGAPTLVSVVPRNRVVAHCSTGIGRLVKTGQNVNIGVAARIGSKIVPLVGAHPEVRQRSGRRMFCVFATDRGLLNVRV
jgi:YVTN family beta-propeller protein